MAHCNHCNCECTSSVSQTLDELDFERGIWFAAQYNDVERVRQLLNKGTCVNVEDKSGYTALHYAARWGHSDLCRLLLKSGANVNSVTRSGRATPLHRAATTGHKAVVELLLEWGADAHLQDADGKTILHRAAEQRHGELVKEIVKRFPTLVTVEDSKGNLPNAY